jgi:hypothetical protein
VARGSHSTTTTTIASHLEGEDSKESAADHPAAALLFLPQDLERRRPRPNQFVVIPSRFARRSKKNFFVKRKGLNIHTSVKNVGIM